MFSYSLYCKNFDSSNIILCKMLQEECDLTQYDKMREPFKADGFDEYTIEKFIRQEIEMDEFQAKEGIADINATRE